MLFKCRKCSRQKTSSITHTSTQPVKLLLNVVLQEFVELIYNGGRIVLVSIVRARKVVVMRFASEERSLPNDDSVAW